MTMQGFYDRMDLENDTYDPPFNPKTDPGFDMLPTPIPPGVSDRFIDHIETAPWGEIFAMAFLIIVIGMGIGALFAQ